MKRSEMVEHIAEALLVMYGGGPDEWDPVRKETLMRRLKTANIALQTVEEKDMLPPRTMLKDPGHGPGEESEYMWNAWEQE